MRVGPILMLLLACNGRTPEQRACEDYARAFAEASALRCGLGSVEDVVAAFKVSAEVGPSCELVRSVRDADALEDTCLPWLRDEVACDVLDDTGAYLEALPDACREQLQVTASE